MDISLLRRIIRQESPSRFLNGTVVGTDPRGTRTASVRVSGGRVHTRVYTCDDGLEVGDQVICARMESLDRLVVIGRIRSKHGSPLSQQGVLAPPSNFAALSFPGIAYCQWDTYPGECTSWEVEYALQADKSDKASVLVSRGSYYLYPCDPGTTVYFRARALRWLSDNNLMYSGWSGWSSVVCNKYEVPRLLVELTNKAGKQVEEGWVVVIDKANASSFKTTVGADDEDVIGVAFETIADNAVGLVCISGLVDVYVSDAPAIGDYLISSVTEGNATGDVTATKGTFGRALTTKAGNTVSALLDPPLSGTSGGLPDVAGAGYALVSDGVNSWAVDLTPPWLGTHTWGSGFNVMPADASGQDLGDATHRWDLYTQDVIFGGATGANVITVPDNVADALGLLDAGGLEHLRIVSTNANPYFLIDPTGAGIRVAIGVAVPNQVLTVEGTIDLKEQAAANADVAAYGQIWVKNTAPNELWFTDDTGVDIQLGLGGGLPNVAGAGYALVSDGVNSWVADQTPAWTGEHSFAAGIAFAGASGANEITIPDNVAIALELLDTGGLEYIRIISTDANPYVIIDSAVAGIKVGIGITPTAPLTVQSNASAHGIRVIGRGDDGGLLEFYENDGVTLEGMVFGIAGRLTLVGPDSTSDLSIITGGKVGIGAVAIPIGGVGYAKFAIVGTNANAAGPHIQLTTASDNYPLVQMLPWQHDSIALAFDAYYDGADRSSDAGSNARIRKGSDKLTFAYDSGVAQGAVVTWNDGLVLDLTNGYVGLGIAPVYNFQVHESSDAGVAMAAFLNPGAATAGRETYILLGKSLAAGGAGVLGFFSDTATPTNARVVLGHWGDSEATEYLNILKDGNVGIGTPEPGQNVAGGAADYTGRILHVKNASVVRHVLEGDYPLFEVVDLGGAANDKIMTYYVDGGLATFYSRNDNLTTRTNSILVMDMGTGAIRFGQYGAGDLQTDAVGNISAVSDARLKEQIRDTKIGLAEVLQMQGKAWHYTKESGLDTEREYLGFIADDIEKIVPGAVGRMKDGMRTMSYSSLMPAFVAAVQELNERIEQLEVM